MHHFSEQTLMVGVKICCCFFPIPSLKRTLRSLCILIGCFKIFVFIYLNVYFFIFLFFIQVQGMSFLAAVLLLNMDVADAFICFANLLNGPCQVAFFRVDEGMVRIVFLLKQIQTNLSITENTKDRKRPNLFVFRLKSFI